MLTNGTGYRGKGGGTVCPVVPLIGSVGCKGTEIIGISTGQPGRRMPGLVPSGALVRVMLLSQFAWVVPPSLSPQ